MATTTTAVTETMLTNDATTTLNVLKVLTKNTLCEKCHSQCSLGRLAGEVSGNECRGSSVQHQSAKTSHHTALLSCSCVTRLYLYHQQ